MACFPEEIFKNKGVADKYTCPIGYGILRNPVRDPHNHLFCELCIKRSFENSFNCPLSRSDIRNLLHPAKDVQEEMNKEEIVCVHSGIEACEWEGTLGQINDHLAIDCNFEKIKCPNKDCPEMLFRCQREWHKLTCRQRPETCDHCKLSLPVSKLQDHVSRNCPEVVVPCQRNCGSLLLRKLVEKHFNFVCPSRVIDCKYKIFGCNFSGDVNAIGVHTQVASFFHLSLAQQATNKIMFIQEQIQDVSMTAKSLINRPDFEASEVHKTELKGLFARLSSISNQQKPHVGTTLVLNSVPSQTVRLAEESRAAEAQLSNGEIVFLGNDFNAHSQLVFRAKKQSEETVPRVAVGFFRRSDVIMNNAVSFDANRSDLFKAVSIGENSVTGLLHLRGSPNAAYLLELDAASGGVEWTNLENGESVRVEARLDLAQWQPFFAIWGTQTLELLDMTEKQAD